MKISNVEQLRDYILKSIERLENSKIDIDELSIIAKAGESVLSSIKLELAYNNMRNETPNIKFLQDCNKGIKQLNVMPKKIFSAKEKP